MDMEQIRATTDAWLDANKNPYKPGKMVWLDIETTGLDLDSDIMIEIGLMVTDAHGYVVDGGVFESIIYQPSPIDWNHGISPIVVDMHRRSQLAQELENAPEIHNIGDVEDRVVKFLKGHFGPDMSALKLPISGSSVHFDKAWLAKRMPKVSGLFSHRIIDVSSDDEKAKAREEELFDDALGAWRRMGAHRVIPDIIDSIEMYRFYNPAGR